MFISQTVNIIIKLTGAVAQLGERVLGMDEVGGSNPLSSTKGRYTDLPFLFCFPSHLSDKCLKKNLS